MTERLICLRTSAWTGNDRKCGSDSEWKGLVLHASTANSGAIRDGDREDSKYGIKLVGVGA